MTKIQTTVVAGDPAEQARAGRDWDSLAAALGGSTIVAWRRAAYCLLRADAGKGAVPEGTVIPGVGAGWATACEHGTIRPTTTGNAAERAGKDRRSWCPKCSTGAAPSVPAVGAPAAPVKPSTGKAKGTPRAARTAAPAAAEGSSPSTPLASIRAQAEASD